MAKATATEGNGAQKTVLADCVSVLLMALGATSITKAQYEMMSALDGSRTASSFEHQFRSITARAKELKARIDDGETFQPVAPAIKRGGGTSPLAKAASTPKKRKNATDDDEEGTPSKKKATPKARGKKAPAAAAEGPTNDLGFGSELPEDMEEFIKNEQQKWESGFA
ncbi:hypothetical protein CC86DRAFT_402182 [Ophiobolus disseminans]|uniref:Uncharacterized protein n=1 Tax=Ophiobolus disseminans TaxID=1469910 RepID=A0A6A7AEI4_9PLEO|nr:hypothetical protein CC86DRAFT_402182 [Ophiobolus disseminans]